MEKKRLKNSRYISGFGGLRAFSVIGVIFYHLLPTSLRGGYLGVSIFFALSGYLITDLLRLEWLQYGSINIFQFYVRRLKRLYPALFTMLIAATAYITIFQRGLLNNLRGNVISSLLYYNNWWQINNGISYFDRFTNESPFTHIWYLAVEAQNYVLWPVLFVLLMKFVKKRQRIVQVILGLSLLSFLAMAILYDSGNPTRVYYGTDTRLFGIWLGAALAFVWPSWQLKGKIPVQAKRVLNFAGLIAFLGLIAAFFTFGDQSSWMYRGGFVLVSLLSLVLIAVTAHPGASWNKWLSNPLFSWIDQRSYGIYLYQYPVMIFYEARINVGNHVMFHTVIEILLILLFAELSYRYVELPWRRKKAEKLKTKLKSWIALPLSDRRKLSGLTKLAVLAIAVIGLALAPKNQVTADQQALQEKIAANQKAAAKSRQAAKDAAKETSGTTAESSGTDSTSSSADASTLTEKEQKTAQEHGLTAAQFEMAKELDITAVGDSVLLDATTDLKTVFPKIVVDGEVGRQLYKSGSVFQELSDQSLLKDTVLVSLGTNGSFTEAQFDSVMSIIGTKRKVYWLNVRVPTKRWQNDVNTMLTKMAAKYHNITIIDWYDYSNSHSDWFYDDQVHPNPTGMIHYVSLIGQTVLKE